MNDKDTNFLAPILSAIAGLGAIIAALSPLFTQTKITRLFIDVDSSGFLAVMAFVLAVLTLWLFGSRTLGLIFSNTIDLAVLARRRVAALVLFAIFALGFYTIKILYVQRSVSESWGEFFQAVFYLGTFFFLTVAIGMQFRDTIEQYKWKNNEENKTSNIRQLLISSGQVKLDLTITAITTYNYNVQTDPQNWQNAVRVAYRTDNHSYEMVVDQNVKNILGVAEYNAAHNAVHPSKDD